MADLNDIGIPRGDGKNIELSEVEKVLEEFAVYVVDTSKRLLQDRGANASSKLSQSIRPELSIFGFKIYMEEYYQWVDQGRQPGKRPPIESIIRWIQTKPDVKAKLGLKSKRIKSIGKKKVSDTFKKSAFAIAGAIAKKGTKPTYFLRDTLTDAAVNDFKKKLATAIGRDVAVNLKVILDSKNKLSTGEKRF
jgi:hypothetical protein